MNVFNKITLESLKKNKMRTLVTIIGVMLSTALICAVTTSVSSISDYAYENISYTEGSWHGGNINADKSILDTVSSSDKIESYVYGQQIGYADIESENEYKPYLYILGTSDNFEDVMPVHIISGHYPENSNEILLPEHLATNGNVHYKEGDTITLDTGKRITSDGYELGQFNPFLIDSEDTDISETEILTDLRTHTYTVSGFYERPVFEEYSAPGYTALTLDDKTASDRYDIYFNMKKPKETYTFTSELAQIGTDVAYVENDTLLMILGVSNFDGFYSLLYGFATIVIILVMFGSVSLIYNAFSISVSERTKQSGLLSSLGATKKQIKSTVLFEALTVSAVGIPAGIIVGIIGIGITLKSISKTIDSFTMSPIPMKLSVSWQAILSACVIALVTILISAWIPSKRAVKVSAIQAIRQNMDIKNTKKEIKTPALISKIFGLPGTLAHKYFKRNKKKYRSTVLSLFMSIVLFISASAFCECLIKTSELGFATYGYDISYSAYVNNFKEITPEELLEMIKKEETVDKVAYAFRVTKTAGISPEHLTDDAFSRVQKADSNSETEIPASVYFIDEHSFDSLLDEYNLDKEKFSDTSSPLAVTIDDSKYYDIENEKLVEIKYINSDNFDISMDFPKTIDGYICIDFEYDEHGEYFYIYRNINDSDDIMKLTKEEALAKTTLKSGKTIHERPYFISDSGEPISLIYPESMRNHIFENITSGFSSYSDYNYKITASDHKACFNALSKLLEENGFSDDYLHDYAENVEQERSMVSVIKVFAYGFIIMISLIAVANVFNTISTNVILRRREFAMLRSVGMTNKGFNKMMNYECLLYGTKALMYGLPVSFIMTYFINNIVADSISTDFIFPWSAVIISVLSVFSIVFITMMYSMQKIKKDNTIETLKNENI